MMKRIQPMQLAALVMLVISISAVALFAWLKAPYGQPQPKQIAVAFLTHLQAGDFAKAHELTEKSGFVGNTPQDLEKFAQFARFCPGRYEFNYTHPPQTHGNRLRRWWAGRDVEMSEVTVDFTCLQNNGQLGGLWGAKLRRVHDGPWRVRHFGLHAG